MANHSKRNIIEDNRKQIEDWLAQGVEVKTICKHLGVSKNTFYKYFNVGKVDAVKLARQPAIDILEQTMFKSATGFVRKVTKYEKCKTIEYNKDGKKLREIEQMVPYEAEEFVKPSDTAGIFLLKNWAGYMNEPATIDIRKKEVELKEKQIENNSW